jgi:hypothetical protein
MAIPADSKTVLALATSINTRAEAAEEETKC